MKETNKQKCNVNTCDNDTKSTSQTTSERSSAFNHDKTENMAENNNKNGKDANQQIQQ